MEDDRKINDNENELKIIYKSKNEGGYTSIILLSIALILIIAIIFIIIKI